MLVLHALLLVHIPNKNLLMIRVWCYNPSINRPAFKAVNLPRMNQYLINFKLCLLPFQLLLICTSRLTSSNIPIWVCSQSTSACILFKLVSLLSNINFSHCKEWSCTSLPFRVIVFVIISKFVSPSPKVYLLPSTCIIHMHYRSPTATRCEMVRPESIVKIIECILASISKYFVFM